MFLLALLVLCVATVPLLGGRLGNLANITFQRAGVGIAALLLQFSIMRVFPEGDTALHRGLHLATYAMMFWFLLANLALPGLWLMGLGGVLNALAIVANQGVMPAHPQALSTAGIVQVPGQFANSAAVSDPNLWFLGDVFALPAGWPMANVFSIGDIVLVLGAFVLLHRMGGSRIAPRLAGLSQWTYRFTGPQATLLREERPFRRLWTAQAVSGIGDWIFPPAVFTALIATNGARPSDLALLLIAQVAPGMLVGLFGGPFIDRLSRKWLMVATDVVRGLAVGSMLMVDAPTLLHVYAVSLVLGIGGAMFQPAFMAVLPNIVPRTGLVPANALVGLSQSVAIMAGFPLGGLIVEQWGVTWAFAANALSFGFCAILVAGTVVPRVVRTAGRARTTLWKELIEGLRYVRRSREVLAIIVVVCMIAVAAGIKAPLEPLFAMVSLGSGTAGLALLGAVWGGGMIAGSFFASAADNRFGHRELISVSVVIVGLCVGIAAFSPGIGPVFMLWLIAGVANTLGTVAYETLIQESTPDEVRGRVMAALEAGLQAGLLVGVVLAGLSDRVTGADPGRAGMAAAGVFFLMAGLAAWWMLHRKPAMAAAAAFEVRGLEIVPIGGLGLLRVTLSAIDGPPPVLVADDGSQVHRLEPLPGAAATADGSMSLGYGVPKALLGRAALSLEVRGRGLVELSV